MFTLKDYLKQNSLFPLDIEIGWRLYLRCPATFLLLFSILLIFT